MSPMSQDEVAVNLFDTCKEYQVKVAALEADNKALRRDKERLDWIESQTDGSRWVARQSTMGRGFRLHNIGPSTHTSCGNLIYGVLEGDTVRDAIDTAMSCEAAADELNRKD